MLNIRQATPEEYPQMKELWHLAFGDSKRFIDGFFERVRPEALLVLLEDGNLCSMVSVLQNEVVTTDGDRWKSGYAYGLATHADARGKGYASLLLDYVDSWLKWRGCACVTTVPASPALFPFFTRLGYAPIFSHQEITFSSDTLPNPVKGQWAVLSSQEYAEKRELFLNLKCGYAACGGEISALQQWISQSSGGNLYELVFDGGFAVAAVELLPNKTVLVKELLAEPDDFSKAVSLLPSIVPAPLYHVRTMPEKCSMHPFGMLKSYFTPLQNHLLSNSFQYFGLGLD